jgi:hypothetical protein
VEDRRFASDLRVAADHQTGAAGDEEAGADDGRRGDVAAGQEVVEPREERTEDRDPALLEPAGDPVEVPGV